MAKIIKAICDRAEQRELAKEHRAIEHYPAFVLLQVDDRAARRIGRRFPVEDVASRYRSDTGERVIEPIGARRGGRPSGTNLSTIARPVASDYTRWCFRVAGL